MADRGHQAIRLEKGAQIKTKAPVRLPPTGFSLLLKVRINEPGDRTVGNVAHNHAIVCHPSMVLIVTWSKVIVWHFPFPGSGKAVEANTRFRAGQRLTLGWVVTRTTMAAYVDGVPIARRDLPLPLAQKAFRHGPFVLGGPYGKDRPLSLDVCEFIYADEVWDDARMAARALGARAKLTPDDFAERPLRPEPTLVAGGLRLWIDPTTGQVHGLSHGRAPGRPAARSMDTYLTYDGRCSSEAEDRVLSQVPPAIGEMPSMAVRCRNDALGLDLTKRYSIDPVQGQVTKSVTLSADKSTIVAVEACTVVEPSFRRGAFYSQWLHHVHQQRLFIPASQVTQAAAAAPQSKMQSRLLLLTHPDAGWTYAEAPTRIDGEPVYPSIPDRAFGRRTTFTPDGWRVLRGIVELRPDTAHTIETGYWWLRTSHLGFLRHYTEHVYRPAFAPQPGSARPRRDLACDCTGVFLCNVAAPRGEKLVYNGRPGVWACMDLSGIIERISPRAYGTLVIFEGFSHGDLLSDNVYQWWPSDRGGPAAGKTNVFRTSLAEYMRILKLAQEDLPRLRLGRYERVGVMSWVTETPQKRPDILSPAEAGAPANPSVFPVPMFWDDKPVYVRDTNPVVYFRLLGGYFDRLVKLGLPIAYMDYSVPTPYVYETQQGVRLMSWPEQIAAVRKMAQDIHAAGGTYFSNLPSGPWTDLGYMEYTPWGKDDRQDWRIIADRLQLCKAQEMFPNTTVPLYFQTRDYPMRCLAYNLAPNPFFYGWFDRSGSGPVVTHELLRLRWALRDAEITAALVRPLPWEPDAPPVEACVMRLGQELYVPLICHADQATHVKLTASLRGLLSTSLVPVWRCDFAAAPWNGPSDKPFTTDRVRLRFTPVPDALHEDRTLHLALALEPESLTLILIGDWRKHPPFAPR